MERRKLRSIEKAEEIISEEERELQKKLSEVRDYISRLRKEVEDINREVDRWTGKLNNRTLTSDELSEILTYTSQLSLKARELLKKIAEAEEREREIKGALAEKVKMGISLSSVKKRVKEKIKSEERAKEIRELDEYTRIRRWFTTALLFVLLLPGISPAKKTEEKLLSPPPELVKVLKRRKREIEEREARLKVEEKFVQTLKDDVSFLLNVLGERLKKAEGLEFGRKGEETSGVPSFSNEEVKKVYRIISRLPPDEGGQILSNVKPQVVAFLLLHVNSMQAANLLANMDVKKAAKVVELLSSLAPEKAKSIFRFLEPQVRGKIESQNGKL